MTSTASSTIIHGPLKSSRFGNALVFDITAPQTNLVVERGSALPRASVIVTSAARRIIELSKAGEKVETILLVGSEESPPEHPDIREITENLRALRDKWFQRAKLVLDSPTPAAPAAGPALHMYDSVLQVFEWGTAKTFTALTGEKGTDLTALTKHLGAFENLVLQVRFVRGDVDNSSDTEVRGWIKRLLEISPKAIEIVTGAPIEPANGKAKGTKAVTKTRLDEIVEEISEKTGLPVSVLEYEALLG